MNNQESIITYVNYGTVTCSIKKIMQERNLTKTQLAKRTGLHHIVLERYITGNIARYDGDVLAKLCYVLNCDLTDIISYNKPVKNNN